MKKNIFLKISLIWNETILREEALIKPKEITIGTNSNKSLFAIESTNIDLGESFKLLKPLSNGRYLISILATMKGNIEFSDKDYTLDEFRDQKCKKNGNIYSAEIEPFSSQEAHFVKANIDINDKTFSFNYVTAKVFPLGGAITFDRVFAKYLIMVAILHAVIVLFISSTQTYTEKITFSGVPERWSSMLIELEKPIKDEPEKPIRGKKNENQGKAMSGKQGKVGLPDKPKYLKTKIPKKRAKLIRASLKNRGVFSVIKDSSFANLSNDDSNVASRLAAANFNGINNEDYVAGIGSNGTGIRGTSTGGGGGGGYGRIGGTEDIDTGGGRNTKISMFNKKRKEKKLESQLTKGKINYSGYCKKSDIRRVVSARSKTIKFCYSKELQRFRDLKGKVKLMWIINLNGTVEKISVLQDNIKNNRMNSCLKRQIKRWEFSKPEGGKCKIMYPFIFSST